MNRPHDIYRGSQALATLHEGIPRSIEPEELRRLLHAYRDMFTTIGPWVNTALDGIDELREMIEDESKEREALDFRLFDAEKGVLVTFAKKKEVSRLYVVMCSVLTGVVVASVMLALSLAAGNHSGGVTP